MISLTVMGDVGGCARSENDENTGITAASGIFGIEIDLKGGPETISQTFTGNQTGEIYCSAAE